MFEEENRDNKPGRSLRTCRNHSNWVVQMEQLCLNGTSWKATFERHILRWRKVGTRYRIRDGDELENPRQTFAEINSIPSDHGLGLFGPTRLQVLSIRKGNQCLMAQPTTPWLSKGLLPHKVDTDNLQYTGHISYIIHLHGIPVVIFNYKDHLDPW